MIDTLGSPWLAYAVLVITTVAARLRCGSWIAPAAFVGLVWTFFIGASLAIADYSVPGCGLWMLVLLIVAIQFGALIAHELYPQYKGGLLSESPTTLGSLVAPCRFYGLLCAAVAFAGCIYFLFTSLQEFDLPFTWLGVLEVGARWTGLRNEDAFEPWSVRLLVTWFHPACLLGGILFACSQRRRDRVIGVVTILPSIAYGLLTGARAAILLGLTCWFGGYVSTLSTGSQNGLAVFTRKRVGLLLLGAVSMVAMFSSIDAIRDTSWSHELIFNVEGQKLSNYIFGPPAAFAEWYAHFDSSPALWGARTFAGEFDLLHLKARVIGTYMDKTNIVGTESTNVYTLFRGLIEDFTGYGATLSAILIGVSIGSVYANRGRHARRSMFWLSMFYSAFLFSPLVSLFSFNGAALAWVVGGLILITNRPAQHRP